MHEEPEREAGGGMRDMVKERKDGKEGRRNSQGLSFSVLYSVSPYLFLSQHAEQKQCWMLITY